jgi:asparagine synthase (glutamine-hydrolysing)
MCGIAGIITNKTSFELQHQLKAMLEVTKHRGPDASESWMDTTCCLGHNRLSIIDLHIASNQPMQSNCGRYVIVFNGEIYNYLELKETLKLEYTFKTQSDTEVLLAAFIKYGTNVAENLNGMFAFLIWDKEDKKVFACRDRFGVKPFYFTIHNGNFYFASEIKAFFAARIPKKENWKVWANYLVYGSYGMPNETFWDTIEQLPGGHSLEFTIEDDKILYKNDLKISCWYDFVCRVNTIEPMEESLFKSHYLAILNDSISLRFRADVKIGFNISGGLDSSVLLALVNKQFPDNKTIEAFTFYSDNKAYDELPWVEQMIAFTGNPLNKCLLRAEDIDSLIKEVSKYQDEPFGGFPTLAYSLIFKEARRKNITVLLDGQGMDEAWAGYDYYHTNSGYTVQGTTTSPFMPEVLVPEFVQLSEKDRYPQPFSDPLKNMQYRDIFFTKIPRALRFNDRISMMNSTELREPFLDYRLVELAFAQDSTVKIKDKQTKWMLRQLVKEYLGNSIALAPKRPLQTPQREWIANELNVLMTEKINAFASHPFVQKEEVLKSWDNYIKGNSDNSFYLWQWVNTNSIL